MVEVNEIQVQVKIKDDEIKTIFADDISLYGLSVSKIPLNHLMNEGNLFLHPYFPFK